MRSNEEIEHAALMMRLYAARQNAHMQEAGMAPLWDTDTRVWDQRTAVNKLRKLMARSAVADSIAEVLRQGLTAEQMLCDWSAHLSDTPVYLQESGDEAQFWNEYRMEVNFARWLLGFDWPSYCTMWRLDPY